MKVVWGLKSLACMMVAAILTLGLADRCRATSVGWYPATTNAISVSEGAGVFPELWVQVYDNLPQAFSCSVDWRITGGTGRLGIDYDVPKMLDGTPITSGTLCFSNQWNRGELEPYSGPIENRPIPGTWWPDSFDRPATNFVSILDDSSVESSFTIELTLENATGCPLNPAIQPTITLTVLDNDAIIHWDEWDENNVLSVPEGGRAALNVHMQPALSVPVTIDLSTGGTLPDAATVGQDYAFWPTPSLSRFTMPPGLTNVTVWVQTIDDTQAEQDETFEVRMSTDSGPYIWNTGKRSVCILDDDPWASISFVTNSYRFSETDGPVSIEVRLSQPAGRDVWAWLDTSEGSAHYVSDYTLRPTADPNSPYSNRILIPAGATSTFFDFIPKIDSLFEGDVEQATLRLVNMVGCSRGQFTACAITLQDDTPAPTASVVTNRVDVQENAGFTLIPVRLTQRAAMDTAIRYEVTGGSAAGGGVDYTLDSGTLVIPAYTTEANLEVPVTNDSVDETNETFVITFSSGTLGQGGWPVQVVGANNTVVTILDQDAPPTLRFSPFNRLHAGDPGSYGSSDVSERGSVALEVVLSRPSEQTVTVSFGTVNLTASNADYSVSPQTLQFDPGDRVKTLTVTAAADGLAEGDEILLLSLQNATNAVLGPSQLQVLIWDGDGVAVEPEPATVVGRASGHKVRCRKAAVPGPGEPLGDIDAAEALLALRLPNTNVVFEVSDTGVPVINYTDAATNPPPQGAFPSDRDFHQIAGSPTFAAGDIDDFAMSASGYLHIPTEGNWSFSVRSDEGFRLRMGMGRTIVSECVGQREPSNSVAIVNIPRPGYYAYELTYFDRSGGAQVEFAATPPPFFAGVELENTDQLVGAPRPWSTYSEWSEIHVYQDVVDTPVVLYTNTLVAAGDTTLHGRSVIVEAGATLTLGGVHHLRDLCVAGTVTHNRGDTNGVSLVVDGLLEVAASGKIDVTGKGYRGGYRDGNPSANAETNAFGGFSTMGRTGGSYGSLGLSLWGTVNPLYGSATAPVWLGSGGGSSDGSGIMAGNGGGRIDVEAFAMVIDGQVLADGGAGANIDWTGDGSGGSIRLRLAGGAFSGSGTIRTAGGSSGGGSARGGMGRIAITGYSSYGFVGSLGNAGTLFRQQADTGGDLLLDTTMLVIPPGVTNAYASLSSGSGSSVITNRGTLALTADTLTLPARITLVQDGTVCGAGRADGAIGTLTVASNAVMTHTRGNARGVQIRVDGLFRVEAGGTVDVTGKGFRGGYRDGNPSANAEPNAFGSFSTMGRTGGSYGSLGLSLWGTVNPLYGSEIEPVWLGSGGGSSDGSWVMAGNGGGRVDVEAFAMVIDGQVLADGGAGANVDWTGDGSGGSIWLRLTGGAFSGSGTICTAGGSNGVASARGGMGRIAVTGYGSYGFVGALGCAGTLFRQQAGTAGDLLLDTTMLVIPPGVTNTYATLSSGAGSSVITNRGTLALTADALTLPSRVTLIQDGTVCGTGRTDRAIGALTVASNAVMTHTRGNTNGLQLRVGGLFRVAAGGKLDVTGKGYRGGYREGNPSANAETNAFGSFSTMGRTGGSYGSLGLSLGGTVNPLYGSEIEPVWLGSGGGSSDGSSTMAGNGGGRVDVEAFAMVIDGQVLADGGAGANVDWTGDGSGGSIWLRLTGGEFSGSGTIRTAGGSNGVASARGGMGRIAVTGYGSYGFAGALGYAGTLFRQQTGTAGDLMLDATTLVIPPGVTNTYASLSSGAGASVITNRGTLALTADALTVPSRVTLVQDGTVCGTGRTDRTIGALTVASNAVMTHTRGFTNGMQLRVNGLFRVDAGGLIDVTAKGCRGGYRDGNPSANAETNAFGTFSANGIAGGSYGSLGLSKGGMANPLYGSETEPVCLGSGGASNGGSSIMAGNGGGRVDVEAFAMVIDGQVLADGGTGASTDWAGDGSGGTVWLRLAGGAFTGGGTLRAAGGSSGDGSTRGGGGRIAITGYSTASLVGPVSAGGGSLYWEPAVALDSDGDGLSDPDEAARGTNPTLRDTDGDGAWDGDEVAADTNPLSTSSLLAFVSLTPAPDGMTVAWRGGTHATQVLQRITSLDPLVIGSVYTNLPPTALTNSFFDPHGTSTSRFYRVVIPR